jgi:hypothetical protein
LFEWLKKKFYYGKSLSDYKRKVKEIWLEEVGNQQMSVLWRYLIFLKNKKFYKHPLLAFGVLILKTLEFGAGGMGLVVNKIRR